MLHYFEIKKLHLLLGSKNGPVIQICKVCIALAVLLALGGSYYKSLPQVILKSVYPDLKIHQPSLRVRYE